MNKNFILLDHLDNNRDALQQSSKLIGLAKHGINLGSARESLISNFLKQNLPEYIRYHSGEIFDSENRRSGQIDIILHPITSPKIHLHNTINIFPAETVLLAIEVKSNLTSGKTGQLSKAIESCKKLKQLEITTRTTTDNDIIDKQRVPFVVFAYKGAKLQAIRTEIERHASLPETTYRCLPDLIVVLDEGYYIMKSSAWHCAGANYNDVYK